MGFREGGFCPLPCSNESERSEVLLSGVAQRSRPVVGSFSLLPQALSVLVFIIRKEYQRTEYLKWLNKLQDFRYRSITVRYRSITPGFRKRLKRLHWLGTEVSHPEGSCSQTYPQL